MNIKDHIEAGHYPRDAKGRAMVPSNDGQTVTIYATDAPIGAPIVGYRPTHGIFRWSSCGTAGERGSGWTLLPPPPRKVEVKAFAIMLGDGSLGHFLTDRARADKFADGWQHHNAFVVELTGTYEEPWE